MRRTKVSFLIGLMTSVFLCGFTYVILRTDRLIIRRDSGWLLHRCQLSLTGAPGWTLGGNACRHLNSTQLSGNSTESLQNATTKVSELLQNATVKPDPLSDPKPAVEPPAPFDRVNPLRGYVGVPNGSEQLSMRCRVCAVVSNSGHLLNYKAGNEIDSADCVIRMNDAPVLGFEQHVGSRTSLRVLCFQSVYVVPVVSELYRQAGRSALLGWGPLADMDTRSGKAYRKLTQLNRLHPDLQVYMLTQDRMAHAGNVYKTETGKSLAASGTWLSTGWFTMLVAMEMCDVIKVYGLSSEDYCKSHPNDTTRYHYYESVLKWLGPQTKECDFYRRNQRIANGAHRYFTEKSIFSRWAPIHNVTFLYPAWSP